MSLLRFFFHAGQIWYNRNAGQHAGALAYFMLFALTPLLFFSLEIVGYLTGVERFQALLLSWGNAVSGDLTNLLTNSVSHFTLTPSYIHLPIIGLIFLVIMIYVALSSVSVGLQAIWQSRTQNWVEAILRAVKTVVFIVTLQIYFVFLIWSYDLIGLLSSSIGLTLSHLVTIAFNFMTTVILIWLMYTLLTVTPPSHQGCWVGAFVAGTLLVFTRLVVSFQFTSVSVQSLYSAAGLLISLLIWLYIISAIVFYGAAVAVAYDEHRHKLHPATATTQ